jgi:regulator of sigma E protease
MWDFLRNALSFLMVIGIIVTIHEFGHYFAARWRKIPVTSFSLGFGRAIYHGTDRRGTHWKLGWIPFGGYITTTETGSPWSRACVVAAGPLANFVLALALFVGIFYVIGSPNPQPILGEVRVNSPASVAGLRSQDRVVAIDDTLIETFAALRSTIGRQPDKIVMLKLWRDGMELRLPVKIGVGEDHSGILGISPVYESISLLAATRAGIMVTWTILKEMTVDLFSVKTDDLGGPIRIAQMTGHVAQLGIASLGLLTAVLSLNIGLINLIPLPILDGGQLLFCVIEAIRGKPLSRLVSDITMIAGGLVVLSLIIFTTWNDIARLLH